jgi:hypothetical protein
MTAAPSTSVAAAPNPTPRLIWPQNVPSRVESAELMLDPSRVEETLQEPTASLMQSLAHQQLLEAPEDVDPDRWQIAVATIWRLKAGATLAIYTRTHDEQSLQSLFEEAAQARDWLTEMASDEGFEASIPAHALCEVLNNTWGEVLTNAPPPSVAGETADAVEAPRAPRPLPRPQQPRAAPVKNAFQKPVVAVAVDGRTRSRRMLMVGALAAAFALWFTYGYEEDVIVTGGAPVGWILAGDYHQAPAILMPASNPPTGRAQVEEWLAQRQLEGVRVEAHGTDEWILFEGQKP